MLAGQYNTERQKEQKEEDLEFQNDQLQKSNKNLNSIIMEENIPSMSSARNTQRRLNLNSERLESAIGVVNFER